MTVVTAGKVGNTVNNQICDMFGQKFAAKTYGILEFVRDKSRIRIKSTGTLAYPKASFGPALELSRFQKLGFTDVDEGNLVTIDPEKFTPDQKKDFDAMMQQARDQFLYSLMQTRKGTLDGKGKQAPDGSAQPSDKGATDGSLANLGDNSQGVHGVQGDGSQGIQGDGSRGVQGGGFNQDGNVAQVQFNNFQDQIDYAVHHALINQSGILTNTLANKVKSMIDGSMAEYQATGLVYLQGGVFPNYRPLVTDNLPVVQSVPLNAPSAQPMAPASAPAPTTPPSAPGQLINPRLLVREQPQHAGQNFHSYFYSGIHEMKLSDLMSIKQKHDEPMHEYVQRFREMRNKCYSLSLTDAQFADLAFQGMIPPIREKFSSEDFESLSHLTQKVALHEQRNAEARKNSRKVNHVCPYIYGSDDEDDDFEIATDEWVRSKKVVKWQWVKNSGKKERYDFDITKADKIFDLLLREKQIQLSAGHTIPSAEELGKKSYCKWHNSWSHTTNHCKVLSRPDKFIPK
uniref:Retrotransposon protein, putative, unclassified n=1 Tax=Oryza sativa subsp. japonica TaxID=39947 RepID=Q2QRZ7_ORYSJ|nr:retrotransposon protein, putative, unclassified [Oryza sativa Japonica Group]